MTTWQDIKLTLKLDPAEQASIEKMTELSVLRISNSILPTALARQIGVSQAFQTAGKISAKFLPQNHYLVTNKV